MVRVRFNNKEIGELKDVVNECLDDVDVILDGHYDEEDKLTAKDEFYRERGYEKLLVSAFLFHKLFDLRVQKY